MSKAREAELQRRLKEIRTQEETIRTRIHKLEASIVAAPSVAAGHRLRNWNTVPPDEPAARPSRQSRTRWQEQRVNRARSRQAMTALLLVGLLLVFAFWFYHQLSSNGVL